MTIGLDISVLNDQQRTGIAVYTYQLIDALLKINKKDKFILFGIATFDTFTYLKNLPLKKYPNVEMKIYRLPARLFRAIFLLWQKIGWPSIETFTGSVNIFHSFNWYLPPQKRGKIVATIFDLTPVLYPQWHQEKTVQLEKIRLKRISQQADLVVTISENSKWDFLKLFPNKKVEVIYPATANHLVKKLDKSQMDRVLQKYNLQPNFFLLVGTLEPRKNLKSLIKAFLKSNLPNQLVLVGGMGWKSHMILDLIKKSKRIRWLGFVPDEDLPVLYQQARFLVYPSLYEGFGLPVLEAFSSGIPVVTSKISSLPEVGGDAVLYVDPYSLDDIAKKMKLMVNDQRLRNQLINKGFKQAKRYSWEKSAKKLMALYQKLYLR